jgi:preprotein translocase subunit SecY
MLAVYRVGVFVTIPGVNRVEMNHVVTKGGSGSFLGMFNMFSGGALQQMSIFALGIMPYVTSSIVIQLLTVVVPKLDQLNKEGEQGFYYVGSSLQQAQRYEDAARRYSEFITAYPSSDLIEGARARLRDWLQL